MDFTAIKFETLKIDQFQNKQGHKFAKVTFNRPQAMNALNAVVLDELEDLLNQISEDSSLRCLIFTGEGKAFVAGADITEFQKVSPQVAEKMSERGQSLFRKIERLNFPVIAAVNGFALGGGLELALACDFIIASEKAKWGLPEVTLGLLPGYGGTQRLTRKTNEGVAKRVALTGEVFSSEQGEKWGLFAQVFPEDRFMVEVMKIAETLCERAPIAVRMTKACIQAGSDLGGETGFELEQKAFFEVFKTEDKSEGVQAFLEKRKPEFKGA